MHGVNAAKHTFATLTTSSSPHAFSSITRSFLAHVRLLTPGRDGQVGLPRVLDLPTIRIRMSILSMCETSQLSKKTQSHVVQPIHEVAPGRDHPQ